jgi:hypothetical protein
LKYEEEVRKYLQKQDQIKLAYLFGSVVREEQGKLSDVDIAVFLDESLGKKERWNLELSLIADLGDILQADRVDLVVMNDAPNSLNFEVIKANHPLLIRDENFKVDLEQYIMSRYLDRQYYDQRWAENLLKKIVEGTK